MQQTALELRAIVDQTCQRRIRHIVAADDAQSRAYAFERSELERIDAGAAQTVACGRPLSFVPLALVFDAPTSRIVRQRR
jgi:hypothetical protein